MATYLDLVNKVISESGLELDELISSTWTSAEAGRRVYPRIKRNVADAWKMIQMDRNEWEFKTAELSTTIYPRIKITSGSRAAGAPPVGSTFRGANSDFLLTVRDVFLEDGSWTLGTAVATIEFDAYVGARLEPGETFDEVTPVLSDGSFTYLGKGSYDFLEVDPLVREPQWSTFTAYQENATANPVMYIPWDNWFYNEYNFTTSSQTAPNYVSQDFEGHIVFYPQTLNPFRISFIYDVAPQILSAWDDEPFNLPSEYHDWIAWEALMRLALYDKNPDLFAYARSQASLYKNRAERNLMPLMSYAPSPFNRG